MEKWKVNVMINEDESHATVLFEFVCDLNGISGDYKDLVTMQEDDVSMSFNCGDDMLTPKRLDGNTTTSDVMIETGDVMICQYCSDTRIPIITREIVPMNSLILVVS